MKSFVYFIVFIAATLNIAQAEEGHPGISAELVIRSSSDWTGSSLPSYSPNTPEVAVMKFTIPPNTALPIHKHPAINVAYVVNGELTVVQEGGIQRTFKKGDVVIEMVEKWHHGINQASVPVELIVFYATSKDVPLAIMKSPPQ